MKKLLSALLCVMMVVVFMPTMAFATGGATTTNVAKVGETEYATLAAAVSAIEREGKITLIADTDISTSGLAIPAGKSITLDLNGYTVSAANTANGNIIIAAGANLTLSDSKDAEKDGHGCGKIITVSDYNGGAADNCIIHCEGTFTMESGYINAVRENPVDNGQYGVGVFDQAKAYLNGGKIEAGWYAVSGNGLNKTEPGTTVVVDGAKLISTMDYAIYHPQAGKLEIKNGVIDGAAGAVAMNRGNLLISGGQIRTSGTGDTGDWGDGTGGLTNNAVNINAEYGAVNATIEGGTFRAGNHALNVVASTADNVNLVVKGGRYSDDSAKEYVPEGSTVVETEEGSGIYAIRPTADAVAQIGSIGYSTFESALASAKDGDMIRLNKPISANPTNDTASDNGGYTVSKDITIDLNGQSITTNTEAALIVAKDTQLTINDGSDAGSITGRDVGIKMGNKSENDQPANSKLIINNGKITGGNYGIAGNGVRHGTTITVNGGEITGTNATGIYHPQDGTLTVNGGKITGKDTGIEIRSGNLVLTAGEIKGTADSSSSDPNGNGTTTEGAGIAIVQHTTQKPINVQIKGGKVMGLYAVYEKNTQGNPDAAVDQIKVEITGGNFEATGDKAVYCEDETGFIKGGTFNKTLDKEYIASGYIQNSSGTVVKDAPQSYPTGPSTPTDNVTNQPASQGTGTTGATAPTTTANMSSATTVKTESKVDAATGETKNVVTSETTVDNATAEKIVDKAVENKSEEVIIDTTTSTPASIEAALVGIPTATLEAISEKTDADVTVKTDVAEVTLDNKTAGEIAQQATGATVQIVVEKTKEEVNKVEFELKVVDSNGTVISDFNGGNVSVTVKVPEVMKDKEVVCVYIDDNGKVSRVNGQKNADGTFTFVTNHFSTYAIMTEEEADAAIGAQVDELVKKLDDIDLVARSVRTSKGNVKVTLKVDKEGKAIIDELKEAGCTVKYNFYRSTKKRAEYVSKMIKDTKTYTNTYGKKGTVYYYKARVQVYDAEGKLIAKTALKDCKYASRLWKK